MKSFFSFVVISMICLEASAGSSPIVRASKKIPNEYIVVLNEGVSKEAVLGAARELTRIHGGLVRTTYQNLIRGFWVEMNEAQATAMADSPLVDFIEENAELSLELPRFSGQFAR